MTLSAVNAITQQQYGFQVFDWDRNRGGKDGAGQYVIGKVQVLSARSFEEQIKEHVKVQGHGINLKFITLIDCTNEKIASIFNDIFCEHDMTVINGDTFKATSLHSKGSNITEDPFLFILGTKISNS